MAGAVPDREKALDLALAQIDKQFGKGSVMRLGERPTIPMAVIPTGSIALDVALGIGGLPRGRVVEIYGPESSGKTTVALHAVANAQAAGGIAAFIDAEHALDPDYARALGVDTDALLVSQPDTGEQALEITDMLIRSGAIDVIVIDSVAALVPRAEIEGEMGDSHVGLQARLMSQALRKITGALNNTNTTAIFINQLREKIGVMFGSPETTTGGRALKFYASVRLDVRRIEALKDGTDAVGNRTRVKVVKNKVASPFKQAEFDIIYGQGISREGSLIDVGVEQTIIRKSGAWYTYDGRPARSGQGECPQVPQGKSGRRRRDREEDPGEARCRRGRWRGRRQLERHHHGRLLIADRSGAAAACRHDAHARAGAGTRVRPGLGVQPTRTSRRDHRIGGGAAGAPMPPPRPRSRPTRTRWLARSVFGSCHFDRGPGPNSPRRCANGASRTRSPTTVLDRYDEVGLIDDAAFSRAWVSSRHHGRGLARRALASELRQRGVDAEVASVALEDLDPDTEAATARSLVERRLRSMGSAPPEMIFRRLVSMLARKGYPAGVAIGAVKDALAERAATSELAAQLDVDELASADLVDLAAVDPDATALD